MSGSSAKAPCSLVTDEETYHRLAPDLIALLAVCTGDGDHREAEHQLRRLTQLDPSQTRRPAENCDISQRRGDQRINSAPPRYWLKLSCQLNSANRAMRSSQLSTPVPTMWSLKRCRSGKSRRRYALATFRRRLAKTAPGSYVCRRAADIGRARISQCEDAESADVALLLSIPSSLLKAGCWIWSFDGPHRLASAASRLPRAAHGRWIYTSVE